MTSSPILTRVRVADVSTANRLRPASEAGTAAIVASIQEIGRMISPPDVRRKKNGTLHLIAGGHRLAAAQSLGWEEIDVQLWDGITDDLALMIEIDDNLAGAEMTALDTAIFLAERKRLHEKMHPETKAATGAALAAKRWDAADTMSVASFVTATAEKFPAGPRVIGRDGRWWTMADAEAVAARFDASKEPQIDVEHASQLKAPMGEPAPAVGWIKGFEVVDGAIWGRVEWTEEGAALVASRAYRYLSPVFTFNYETGEIDRIICAGLTNSPNLEMAALNAEQETEMDRALLEALGLPMTATAAEALVAVNAMKTERDTARNAAQTPDPSKFVPRDDHQLTLNRIATFETEAKARLDADIVAAVDQAIADGKVAPASKDYHVAACRAEGGFDRFKAHMGTAPKIVAPSNLDGKAPTETQGTALGADALAVCRMFGTDPDAFAAAAKKEH